MSTAPEGLFGNRPVVLPRGGPLYLQLKRWIEGVILAGEVTPGHALPSERDLALRANVSRVTVRKAVQQLVGEGVLVQRHGSGTFVAPHTERVEQSLSQLTSFTDDMARRGMVVRSEWLERGVFLPSPEETMSLGLSGNEKVARINRLRLNQDLPLAIERASVSAELIANPNNIGDSLYKFLESCDARPVRAVQRIRATNIGEVDAALLQVPVGSAGLQIERLSYLTTGRVVEFTRSIYRGDAYDFIAELRLSA